LYPRPWTLEICTPVKQSEEKPGGECPARCEQCELANALEQATARNDMAGWRLVLWTTFVFLLPLVLAIGGASFLRGRGEVQQMKGAGAGLAAGVAIAWVATKFVRPTKAVK
jgi:hypothetical protein